MNPSRMWIISVVLTCIMAISYSASAASISTTIVPEDIVANSTEVEPTSLPDQSEAPEKTTKFSKFAVSCGNWKNACKLSKNKIDYKMTCTKAVKKLKFVKGPKDFKQKLIFCYSCRKYVCKSGSLVG